MGPATGRPWVAADFHLAACSRRLLLGQAGPGNFWISEDHRRNCPGLKQGRFTMQYLDGDLALVTVPMERKLKDLKDVDKMSSTSMEGASMVVLEFSPDVDIEDALQKVREKVDAAEADMPEDAEDPQVIEISFSDIPILMVALTGPIDEEALKDIGEDLADEIKQILASFKFGEIRKVTGDRKAKGGDAPAGLFAGGRLGLAEDRDRHGQHVAADHQGPMAQALILGVERLQQTGTGYGHPGQVPGLPGRLSGLGRKQGLLDNLFGD